MIHGATTSSPHTRAELMIVEGQQSDAPAVPGTDPHPTPPHMPQFICKRGKQNKTDAQSYTRANTKFRMKKRKAPVLTAVLPGACHRNSAAERQKHDSEHAYKETKITLQHLHSFCVASPSSLNTDRMAQHRLAPRIDWTKTLHECIHTPIA